MIFAAKIFPHPIQRAFEIDGNNEEIEKELKKIGAFYKQKTYELIF